MVRERGLKEQCQFCLHFGCCCCCCCVLPVNVVCDPYFVIVLFPHRQPDPIHTRYYKASLSAPEISRRISVGNPLESGYKKVFQFLNFNSIQFSKKIEIEKKLGKIVKTVCHKL